MTRMPTRAGRTSAVVLLLGFVLTAAFAGGPAAAEPAGTDAGNTSAVAAAAQPDHGRTLYLANCAGCHGQTGEGTQRGPSLIDVGEASVDFYLQTGRMPLAEEKSQASAGPPKFGQDDIADLVAYVGSFGAGPPIPTLEPGDLRLGRQLFLQNCAACHDSSGVGYAQVGGRAAPSLLDTDPVQVAEAVRVGPNTMPQYNEGVLDSHQLDAVVSYVQELQQLDGKGGADIGRLGPTTETLVGIAGLALLLIVIRLIGKRAP